MVNFWPTLKKHLFLSGMCIIVALPYSMAQITSSTADHLRTTAYSGGPTVQDTIFIFCPGAGGAEKLGSLTATPISGPAGWNFEWSKLDTISFTYGSPFFTQNNVSSSIVNNLSSGGYRVKITDGNAVDTYLYAWVYVRHIEVTTSILNVTCQYLAFQGTINADKFCYFDPSDHSRICMPNHVSHKWTSDPYTPLAYDTIRFQYQLWAPPTENTDFTLTVTDKAGCSAVSILPFESIFPKADFDIAYELDEKSRVSAPLLVTFTNSSENAVEYLWHFGDGKDTASQELGKPVNHTYYYDPGKYNGNYEITLIATSADGCQDSMKLSFQVNASDLQIPNVFTPNEDNANDRFFIDHVSLRFLHVLVFNRNGQKVYDFLGTETTLPSWEGWDGKILDTNQDASPGVYYYIITAFGWDDKSYKGKQYRGTVYLLREK